MNESHSDLPPTRTVAPSSIAPPTPVELETFGEPAVVPLTTATHIGEYVLLGELGRGGMGVVYRAEDSRLKREIALKVMLPQFAANPQAKARFVREARAQAKVEHDHVATIHQVSDHDGLPYLVMPLLKGMTLQAALKANPRPPLNEVIRISREVAEGLAAAHEKGLVHRDIKPANIWLEGKKLRVKVLDFGLARIVADSDAAGTDGPVTREGAVIGTPAYMSPEQGRGRPVDGRTDLWSLGVILYQMVAGELPFRGATTLAILTSLAIDDPPPPSSLNPAVPQAISDLVLRLLAKDPVSRPPTAEIVAEELRRIEAGLANAVRVIPLDAPTRSLAEVGIDPFTEANNVLSGRAGDEKPQVSAAATSGGIGVSGVRRFSIWMLTGVILLAVLSVLWFAAQKLGNTPSNVAQQDSPKEQPPAIPVGSDRAAAEYLLSIGGTVRVNDEELDIQAVGDLPRSPFRLSLAALPENKQVTDAGLANLKDCKNLTHLNLFNTRVSDVGLVYFKDCKKLTVLGLRGTQVSDEGLVYFKDCKNLTFLDLTASQVTDAGLVHFKDCKRLTWLQLGGLQVSDAGLVHFKDCENLGVLLLNGTQVSDAGLANFKRYRTLTTLLLHGTQISDAGLVHLQNCTELRELYLGKTKVTAGGVEEFKKALPQCKIEYDGGTIEPKVQ